MISSAFPRARSVRFYPMPIGLSLCWSAGQSHLAGKAQKRVRWVSAGLFDRMLAYAELGALQSQLERLNRLALELGRILRAADCDASGHDVDEMCGL